MRLSQQVIVGLLLTVLFPYPLRATDHFVSPGGANNSPFLSWSDAATNIQDAIDASIAGDRVLVTNGIYTSGGKVMFGDLTNRVTLDKALTVQSVNGPGVTTIQGVQPTSSGPSYGPLSVRCAWLTNGATLAGFTLRYGGTRTNGDQIALQSGGIVWASSTNAFIVNCIMTNGSARYVGGGCYQGFLKQCQMFYCYGSYAGGACYQSGLQSCYLANNQAGMYGGGAYGGTLVNCTLAANVSLPSFSGPGYGPGSYDSTAKNCIFYENDCGGATGSASYCCAYSSSLPVGGTGNISAYPQFIDAFHIASTSPCRGAGFPAFSSGTDIDGEPWANPPSMGCDEVIDADLVGPLSPVISATWPEAAIGKSFFLSAGLTGHASRIAWDFGDGSVSNNASFSNVSHAWTNLGNYTVTLTAFNTDHPGGVSTNLVVPVLPIVQPSFISIEPPSFGSVGMFILSQPGVSYTLQVATNLTPPITWQNGFTFTGSGGPSEIVDFSASGPNRFYRVWAH